MSTEVSWVFEAAVKLDSLDDLRALAHEITADNQATEPGQLNFEWFIDGHDVHIYERYKDSAAAAFHVQRFVENFAAAFSAWHSHSYERLRRSERRSALSPRASPPLASWTPSPHEAADPLRAKTPLSADKRALGCPGSLAASDW